MRVGREVRPAGKGLEWQDGGPYSHASCTPRMTKLGAKTSPPASAEATHGDTRPCTQPWPMWEMPWKSLCRVLGGTASFLSPRFGLACWAPSGSLGLPDSFSFGWGALDTRFPGQLILDSLSLWPSYLYLFTVRGAGGRQWPHSQGGPEGGPLEPLPGHGPLLWVRVAVVDLPGN